MEILNQLTKQYFINIERMTFLNQPQRYWNFILHFFGATPKKALPVQR
jgi:hypothetical protein